MAIASLLAEFIVLFCQIILLDKKYKNKIFNLWNIRYCIIGIVLYLLFSLINQFCRESILTTLLLIIGFCIIYLLLLLFLKDRFLLEILEEYNILNNGKIVLLTIIDRNKEEEII